MKTAAASGEPRFDIIRPLGSGGFGAVHEALDRQSGQRVALKELTRVSPSTLFRFKQEFRALADIHHPNLVRLHELIEQDGRWYIVMELVEGVDLLSYVVGSDNDPGFHEERLRSAFAGVGEGLEALHSFGILHRDLKPSNVLVTAEGRAVLLDFGLITSVDSQAQSTHVGGIGTVLYMAPEQVDGQKLGRATDWYAFGSSLYQALTGRPPYEGDSALRIALEKQRTAPPHPDGLAPGLPADLSDLAMRLLEIAPQSRPPGREVLRILRRQAPHESAPSLATRPSLAPSRLFEGRDTELAHLEHALARTHAGELRIVLIEGESGVGKSELVAEFLRQQEQRTPNFIALRGRCYENEQVSYKAFDGCIDELARHLRRMGKDAASLMPVQAPLLAQLFPVLADVPALTRSHRGDVAADPTIRRLQAFSALAALLGSLAEERPLVLVIDDLQWADRESFRLLRAIVEDQARPPVLVLATVRPREELEGEALGEIEGVRDWKCTGVVSLLGLPGPQAEAVAKALLGPGQDPSWASTIALESRGHPLFLAELVHFTQSRAWGAQGTLTLEAALRARIERLGPEARAVLEVAALAARPHAPRLFAQALQLSRMEDAVRELLAQKLLRTRRDQEVGCFHDRIRLVAVSLIPSTRLPPLHRALAEALAQDAASDPTEEAKHWDLAAEPERALAAYERAAMRASETLAFAKAEQLFGRALELAAGPSHPRYLSLTTGRAHALACAGRSADSAVLYQHAAELSSDQEQRLRLRSRTARHLLLSGNLGAGLEACRSLLRQLGVTIPKSLLGALLVALWHRLHTRFPAQPPQPKPCGDAKTRLALELIAENLPALNVTHLGAFIALNAQFARLALRAGDRWQVGAAYGLEGWFRGTSEGMHKAAPLFAALRSLGLYDDTRPDRAYLLAREGSARLAHWQWSEGIALMEEAERLYEAHYADDPFELTVVRYHLGVAWFRIGEHAQLARKADAWIEAARERNDHLAVALLTGMGAGAARHMMRGRVEDSQRELEQSMAHLPAEPFSFAHFGNLIGVHYALILQGGRAAWNALEQRDRELARAPLLKTRLGGQSLALLRAKAATAAMQTASPAERGVLRKAVQKSIALLKRRDSPFTRAFVALIEAELAVERGETDAALRLARKARLEFESIGDSCWRAACYLEGKLEGGEAGQAKCAEMLAFFQSQGWVKPEQALLIHLPILPLLSRSAPLAPAPRHQLIQHYEVVSTLGSGGFGSVVEARDTRTGERVALKELVSKSPRSLERFKQEFRALRNLHHPNLVRFDALFEHHGRWYIAMELVHGQDLLAYVRPAGTLDVQRLYTAFGGLVAALRALHEAGLVHRDVSVDNVRVGTEGRAVLLDFGLVAREHSARDAEALGNADYAPPEQLRGAPPHHAADAHALGVCLYRVLTGRLPGPRPTASDTGAAWPPMPKLAEALTALATCCQRLLSSEPAKRPSLRELSTLLSAPQREPVSRDRASIAPVIEPADAQVFEGRRAELMALHEAAQRAERSFALVMVEGESGLGKSTLVSQFARRLELAASQRWILSGRCYETEQLSFKAFDGVVDELARRLRTLAAGAVEELLPKKAALLAQLFPVLGTVPAIEAAPRKGLPADPSERRSLALSVFMELLERVARARPLLLVIDDLQWADPESAALLHSLAARAEALPMLVVTTLRSTDESGETLRTQLDPLKALSCTSTLRLGSLDGKATAALTEAMLGSDASALLLARIARESQGHPLFLRELVEHARAGDLTDRHMPVSLDQALSARIGGFEPDARRLLSLVALAGKPHPIHVFASALELSRSPTFQADQPFRTTLDRLLNHGLLRRRGDTGVGCYHDRVRHVALATLGASERARCAAGLARALDQHRPEEAAERARLWDAAGQAETACAAHEAAGDAALKTLAFARAAEHYARALELGGEADAARWQRLTMQRAHALVRVGKNAEAAGLYAAAAHTAQGELSVRLRIWAAQNLIKGAQVEDGLRAASQLLSELGLPLPQTDKAAMRRIVWERARLRWRGTALGGAKAPTQADRLALEALSELAQPIASVKFLQGGALAAEQVRRALEVGDPAHAARALGYEGLLRITRKPSLDHAPLFERARELAESTGDSAVIAHVLVQRGIAAVAIGDLQGGRDGLLLAHDLLSTQCPDQRWWLTTARVHLGSAWYYSGDHGVLAAHSATWVEDAKRRGDCHAYAALSGYGFGAYRHLLRGNPDAALEELAEAMAPWPSEPISLNHVGALWGTLQALFCKGGDAAYAYLEQSRPRLQRSPLAKSRSLRFPMAWFAACAALAAIDRPPGEDSKLARNVAEQARILRGLPSPLAVAAADVICAALSALQGKRERALVEVRAALRVLAAHHHTTRTAALYLEGLLEGGATGRAKAEEALAAKRAQGWDDPLRAMSVDLPIFTCSTHREPIRGCLSGSAL